MNVVMPTNIRLLIGTSFSSLTRNNWTSTWLQFNVCSHKTNYSFFIRFWNLCILTRRNLCETICNREIYSFHGCMVAVTTIKQIIRFLLDFGNPYILTLQSWHLFTWWLAWLGNHGCMVGSWLPGYRKSPWPRYSNWGACDFPPNNQVLCTLCFYP